MSYVRPRKVFLVYLTLVIAFSAASVTQRGNTGLAMLMVTLFFESVCFPTIVALGIRGIGRHTKRGSGWIVGGVVGGACGAFHFAFTNPFPLSTFFHASIPFHSSPPSFPG
jgi:FHS family L-fucose permease-like MFS transporter